MNHDTNTLKTYFKEDFSIIYKLESLEYIQEVQRFWQTD